MHSDSPDRPNLLYIMGTGRSGSTTLGIALDNVDGIFYAGEMEAWPRFGGHPNSQSDHVKAFWAKVRKRLPDQPTSLEYFRAFEYHFAALRPWRYLNSAATKRYNGHNRSLCAAILEQAQARWVVDSSHYPFRAFKLVRNRAMNVFVVYLHRDPRDVVNAMQDGIQRKPPMSPLMANVYSLWVHLTAAVVYRSTPPSRRLCLRYEQFAKDPSEVLHAILEAIGHEAPVPDTGKLTVGISFQGNRVRAQSMLSVAPQPSRNLMSRAWQVASTILQLPVLALLKYPLARDR